MAETSRTVGGDLTRVPLADLYLDWRNPRLPPEVQREDAEQVDLALYIDKRYNPLEVAQSIARHGYFESEPLIARLRERQIRRRRRQSPTDSAIRLE